MKDRLKNFVLFPRQILQDLRDGKITPTEYNTCVYVRHCGNPYGVTYTSLTSLSSHFGYTENYTNKLLLSLKAKGYLYYESRTGRKGDFALHFADFIRPDGKVTSIPNQRSVALQSDISQSPAVEIPSPTPSKAQSIANIHKTLGLDVRGSNNDKETEKENENSKTFVDSVESYSPEDAKEQLYKDIAIELEEKSMIRILKTKNKYGHAIVEKAWLLYTKEKNSTESAEDKATLFKAILHEVIRGRLNT